MADELGVTGNAVMLLGFITGCLRLAPHDSYELDDLDAARCAMVVRNRHTDNTYRITVVQVGGVE